MECKNCSHTISSEDHFCSHCGAKVIHNRLTAKLLFEEIKEKVFNLDTNKPLKTFLDLFIQPESVINGFINGVRKKYINPFGYFTIAVTLTSIFYFVAIKFFPENLESGFQAFQAQNAQETEITKKIQEATFEYQSFIFFLFIPFFAMVSWVIFWNKKKYNYIEHLILNLYGYSQASIVAILLYFLTIGFETVFKYILIGAMVFQVLYYAYMFKRVYGLNFIQITLKTLLFIPVGFIFYMIISTAVIILLLLFGVLELADFLPPPPTSFINASSNSFQLIG